MSGTISKKKRIITHDKFYGKCAYCGVNIEISKMHVDHIVPLYRGYTSKELEYYGKKKGTNNIDNLNHSCPTCNISKGTFSVEEWRDQILLKVDRLRKESSNFRLLDVHKIVKVSKRDIKFYFEKIK